MADFVVNLGDFKSSGVYTYEIDSSSQNTTSNSLNRLVVGFSRKGPINNPIYITNKKSALQIFGDIDTQLEKFGSFFHRSLFAALDQGPVYALNLMPINNHGDNADKTKYFSYSLSPMEYNAEDLTEELYSSFYNKERFWRPDPEYLLANVSGKASSPNKGKLLNVVNLGQKPISLLIRKNNNLPQFNITASEWFGNDDNVPAYMEPSDYISDYFIDVTVVQGNWTNYNKLSIDPIYNEYFNKYGIKKNKLKEFLALPHIVNYGTYTGTVIPELRDNNGTTYTIDTILNNNLTASVGLLCALDKEALEEYNAQYSNLDTEDNICALDLVGHTLVNTQDIITNEPRFQDIKMKSMVNFLSYKFGIKEFYTFNPKTAYDAQDVLKVALKKLEFNFENLYLGKNSGYFNNAIVITKPQLNKTAELEAYDTIKNLTIPNKSLFVADTKEYKVINKYEIEEQLYLILANKDLSNQKLTATAIDIEFTKIAGVNVTIPLGTFAAEVADLILLKDTSSGNYGYFEVIEKGDTTYTLQPKNGTLKLTGVSPIIINCKYIKYNTPNPVERALYKNKCITTLVDGKLLSFEGEDLYNSIAMNVIQSGDRYEKVGGTVPSLRIESSFDENGFRYFELTEYTNAPKIKTDINGNAIGIDWSLTNDGQQPTIVNFATIPTTFVVRDSGISNEGYTPTFTTKVDVIKISNDKKIVTIPKIANDLIKLNDYVTSSYTLDDGETIRYRLTRIYKKLIDSDGNIEVYLNSPAHITEDNMLIRFSNIDNYAQTLNFHCLPGFNIGKYHTPDGSLSQLKKILEMLDPSQTNLLEVLKSRNVIQFRYIIDTFDGGISPMTYPKTFLTRLAKERQKCLAIMNAPSARAFKKSNDPIFTSAPTDAEPKPILDSYYISKGGNLDLNPNSIFSLPDEMNGSKFAGYFWPFIMIRENNRNFAIPPAADISNLFVQKHKNGTPFRIVAGQKGGSISNNLAIGLEYDCLDRDRDNLEPMGINPIIMKKGVPTVFGNQMAYQKTQSSFNSLHIRDILITIEEAIEDLLEGYVFELNTPLIRVEIKNKVESYLNKVKTLDGIYNFSVIMDNSNNPDSVINAKTAILDVAIEPVLGIHKFINRIHVYGSGGIQSQGFTANTITL